MPKCFMCEEKDARALKCQYRDKAGVVQEYVNGTKRPLFCSVRCAANYGLLWFDWEGHEDKVKQLGHKETKQE